MERIKEKVISDLIIILMATDMSPGYVLNLLK
jgi:hypothetical protein